MANAICWYEYSAICWYKEKNDFKKDFFKLMNKAVSTENILPKKMRKTEILMNKLVYLSLSNKI